MKQLDGQRVVITGAGSGLGLRIAEVFREEGASVLISDISQEALPAASGAAGEGAGGFEAVVCDVSDEAQVQALMAAAQERLGGLDVLVNNAGIAGPTGPVETLDVDAWRTTFDVNVHGQFYCVKHALPLLRESQDARIINLSSAAGRLGMAGRSAYSSSKWAVIGFTKTLAIELGAEGIKVNAICPGAVAGPRIDRVIAAKAQMLGRPVEEVAGLYRGQSSLGELVTADDIAQAALYLAGPGGRRVNGQALAVDGNTEKLY